MILGVDVSTYLEELEHNARYYDGEVQIDPLDALRANGVSCMRIRVWNDPHAPDGTPYLAGTCDIDHYVRLAKLAKSKGYTLMLDFHYSDFWADPGKQMIPKAWASFDIDKLEDAVYTFTKSCLEKASAEGVAPTFIQVGNEITNGMLWPVGRLTEADGGERGNYKNLCRLIAAGCRACREIVPEAGIILHLERSNDAAVYQEFFSKMQEANIDYDIIGASYYPYWHGTPAELFANLAACRRFGKRIMLVEIGYGFTTKAYVLDGKESRLVIDADRANVPGLADKYPISPEGQAAFLKDLLAKAEENGIEAAVYWEPLWLPGEGICWASHAGQSYIKEEGKSTANEWANQCLFDYKGKKLPAFDVFRVNEMGIC